MDEKMFLMMVSMGKEYDDLILGESIQMVEEMEMFAKTKEMTVRKQDMLENQLLKKKD
jgi:hypothetical protein